jgi:4'-phosphopantetheinyl transferase
MTTIFPVILSVPEKKQPPRGRERVAFLSSLARQALEVSARKSGVSLSAEDFPKDENGAPLPVNGYFWSISHKPEYVAGVVSPQKIGIDIEKIEPRQPALFKKVADKSEWDLGDEDSWHLFFRYWTAKEAVLKAAGIGLKDLSKCKIIQIKDDTHLIIQYLDRKWDIEHFFFNRHIASIVNNTPDIQWILSKLPH